MRPRAPSRPVHDRLYNSLRQLGPEQGSPAHPIRGVPSTAAIVGHPIHPLLIAFPTTFLTAAVATDMAARTTQDPFQDRTSRWMLGAGIVTGLVACAAGAVDYFTLRRAREKSEGKLHAYGNPVALGLAAVRAPNRTGCVAFGKA